MSKTSLDLRLIYDEFILKGDLKTARELRKHALKNGYELHVCSLCEDTGEVSDLYFDSDSKEYYGNGFIKCICRL